VLNFTSNRPPGSTIPESKRPSGAPGVPEVTVCGSPLNVQRTVSPTLTERVSGWKWKLTAATSTLAALTGAIPAISSPASEATPISTRRTARGVGGRDVIEEPYDTAGSRGSWGENRSGSAGVPLVPAIAVPSGLEPGISGSST
jgi:hypothetical protein